MARALAAAVAGFSLLMLATAGCDSAKEPDGQPAPRPSVVVVTIDTLRPDALGYIGGHSDTPFLDGLAARSARFDRAVSPVPLTLPAHTSMFTGLAPPRTGVRNNGHVLDADVPTLARQFDHAGYATAAFVSAFVLQKRFGLDAGFANYDDDLRTPDGAERLERSADETVNAAVEWLQSRDDQPFLLWVHVFDPHAPYGTERLHAAPDSAQAAYAAYLTEVERVDAALARLHRHVTEIRPDALWVVTADHGEAFGEHGEYEHGLFIYDATTIVPMLIHWPDHIEPRNYAIAQPRLWDLAPTLLELAGLPELPYSDGVSLVEVLEGDDRALPAAYQETPVPWSSYGWANLQAWRSGDTKFIEAPDAEFYDLNTDPRELDDLAESRPDELMAAREAMEGFLVSIDVPEATTTDDDDSAARLQSLGYLSTGGPLIADPQAPDPKSRIVEHQGLLRAEHLRRSDPEASAAAFREVLADAPRSPVALLRLGQHESASGNLSAAFDCYQQLAQIQPDHPEAHYSMADIRLRQGELAGSLPHWRRVIELQPRRAAAWANMGAALGSLQRYPEAIDALKQAIAADPERAEFWHSRSQLEEAAGLWGEAAASLQQMARTQNERFGDQLRLAALLWRAGDTAASRAMLESVGPTHPRYVDARLSLAQAELVAGDAVRAAQILELLVEEVPDARARVSSLPQLQALLEGTAQ